MLRRVPTCVCVLSSCDERSSERKHEHACSIERAIVGTQSFGSNKLQRHRSLFGLSLRCSPCLLNTSAHIQEGTSNVEQCHWVLPLPMILPSHEPGWLRMEVIMTMMMGWCPLRICSSSASSVAVEPAGVASKSAWASRGWWKFMISFAQCTHSRNSGTTSSACSILLETLFYRKFWKLCRAPWYVWRARWQHTSANIQWQHIPANIEWCCTYYTLV